MFNSMYTFEVKLMEQQELVKLAAQRSKHTSTGVSGRRTSRFTGITRIVGIVLAFFASVVPDSRTQLRSDEQELASLGMTWQTDSDLDTTLAEQMEAARRGRLAGATVPTAIRPATSPFPALVAEPQGAAAA